MQFLFGLLTAVVFFILLGTAYWLGTKQNKRSITQSVDEETQRKAKKHREDFMKLMNYDVDKATQRKKVT